MDDFLFLKNLELEKFKVWNKFVEKFRIGEI